MNVSKKMTGELVFWFLVAVTGGLFYILIKATGNLVEKIQNIKKNRKDAK